MAEEFSYSIKIPKERVAVLIGSKGKVKRRLEAATSCDIEVDSAEGEVTIKGNDSLNLFICREIIQAIGRGFNPQVAQSLLKPDYGFELISIKDYADTDKAIKRLKGRVIGEEGKSRELIEELTGAKISVYGKTVGLIGQLETLPMARKAIEMLLGGARHATVYRWLERRRHELRVRQHIGEM